MLFMTGDRLVVEEDSSAEADDDGDQKFSVEATIVKDERAHRFGFLSRFAVLCSGPSDSLGKEKDFPREEELA